MNELATHLGGGIGHAQLEWDCYKIGINP